MKVTAKLTGTVFVLIFLSVLVVYSGSQQEKGQKGAASKAITAVKVANCPYMNTMPWILPDIYEWDKELGIDLEISWFADTLRANEATVGLTQDLSMEAISVIMPLAQQAKNIRQFLISDEFRGNAIEIRKGEFKTFEEFYDELGDIKQAQRATLGQMVGKELITTKGIWDANIESALNEGGYSLKDLTIIDMEQSAGAAAFVRGLGDFYFGSLPQHIKLRAIDGGGKYVPMITSKYMGPGGLYITVTQTTQEFIDKHGEGMLVKLAALWYRGIKCMAEYPDIIYPILTKWINEKAGGGWDLEKVKKTVTTDKDNTDAQIYNPQLKDVGTELIKNPNSPTYYKAHALWHINNLVSKGELKSEESIDIETVYGQIENVYDLLMNDQELLDWIYQNEKEQELLDWAGRE
jgi:ABC-type nitrate/sulfonate/bicarbonate transport system substrate-binding protein